MVGNIRKNINSYSQTFAQKSQKRVDLFLPHLYRVEHACRCQHSNSRVTFNQHFAKLTQSLLWFFLCIKFAELCNILQPLYFCCCAHFIGVATKKADSDVYRL